MISNNVLIITTAIAVLILIMICLYACTVVSGREEERNEKYFEEHNKINYSDNVNRDLDIKDIRL